MRLLPRWTQQEWMCDASCKGRTEHFFAPHGEQADAREVREAIARAICVSCPALLPCREYARRHREQGYWGAENDDQRLEARRRRESPALAPIRSGEPDRVPADRQAGQPPRTTPSWQASPAHAANQ